MNDGWVKLPRSLLDFAWVDDPHTMHIYMYLLLNARTEEGTYHDRTIKRGQLATSISQISAATNATIKITRNALERLKNANLITIESTNKYSIITLCDYEGEEPKKKPEAVQDLPVAETPTTAQPFTPPTLEEVRRLFEQYGFRQGGQYYDRIEEIENFYLHYKSKGWMVGQSVMRDWKASAANWIRRMNNYKNATTRNNPGNRDDAKERRDREWAEYISNMQGRGSP